MPLGYTLELNQDKNTKERKGENMRVTEEEFKNGIEKYIKFARAGEEIIVTRQIEDQIIDLVIMERIPENENEDEDDEYEYPGEDEEP